MVFSFTVLSVKSVRDPFTGVQLVQHPVCVVLLTSCENHNFVFFRHLSQKLAGSWPDQEISLIVRHLNVVAQSLIQVKNQTELLQILFISQVGLLYSEFFVVPMDRQIWFCHFISASNIAADNISSLNYLLLALLFIQGKSF